MLSTDRQTDRQTDKQTNATKNITSFAKEVKSETDKHFTHFVEVLSLGPFILCAPLWGDKVNILSHIYPHKPLREIEVIICNQQADSPLYVWPNIWSGVQFLKTYGHTWQWMSLLRPGVIKQHKSKPNQPYCVQSSQISGWARPVCSGLVQYCLAVRRAHVG